MEAEQRTKQVNERIWKRLEGLLRTRNRAEVCRRAGISESTLSTQMGKRRFTLELLAPLAPALDTTLEELVAPELVEEIGLEAAARAFEEVRRVVRATEARGVSSPPDEVSAHALRSLETLRGPGGSPGEKPENTNASPPHRKRASSE